MNQLQAANEPGEERERTRHMQRRVMVIITRGFHDANVSSAALLSTLIVLSEIFADLHAHKMLSTIIHLSSFAETTWRDLSHLFFSLVYAVDLSVKLKLKERIKLYTLRLYERQIIADIHDAIVKLIFATRSRELGRRPITLEAANCSSSSRRSRGKWLGD